MPEETPEERKERLRALREAQQLLSSSESRPSGAVPSLEEPQQDEEDENKDMKFRNYLPRDKGLQNSRIAPPVLPKFEDPVAIQTQEAVEKEDPIVSIAPKKPNWDLHRAVEKKLEKLQRRTQKALIELMQEQLRSATQTDEIADATANEGESENHS